MVSRYTVPNLRRGEEVIIHIRRHWLTFVGVLSVFAFLALLPLVLYGFLVTPESLFFIELTISEAFRAFLLVLGCSYYLLLMVFALTAWMDYYLDVWTITTERVISREQRGLFHRIVSELDITNIQDVTAEQQGMLATFFHYGHVYIQSAAEKERFVFEQIPQPYYYAKMIQKLHESTKRV